MSTNTDSASQTPPLAKYRVMSPRCGLKVSPLQLGAMSLGQAWKDMLGSMDKETSFKLLDTFYEAGGNVLDTANTYQDGESEEWIGEWMQKRKNRDEMVVISKYTSGHMNQYNPHVKINYAGNSYKSMFVSIEHTLKKLQTNYLDVLYVHWWDYSSSVEEVMQGLNNLVKAGKVLYLGVSDTPAWIISKANQYARDHGLAQFCIYQGRWSALTRDIEREILPMCRAEGMAIAPWGALGGGQFQRKADWEAKMATKDGRSSKPPSEDQKKVSEVLESIADELKVKSVTAVAIAYVMAKYEYCYPIVGGRKIEYLTENIEALSIKLTDEQVKKIEEAKEFDIGEPQSVFGEDGRLTGKAAAINARAGEIHYVPYPKSLDRA